MPNCCAYLPISLSLKPCTHFAACAEFTPALNTLVVNSSVIFLAVLEGSMKSFSDFFQVVKSCIPCNVPVETVFLSVSILTPYSVAYFFQSASLRDFRRLTAPSVLKPASFAAVVKRVINCVVLSPFAVNLSNDSFNAI